jgi:hypothetical protein
VSRRTETDDVISGETMFMLTLSLKERRSRKGVTDGKFTEQFLLAYKGAFCTKTGERPVCCQRFYASDQLIG